MIQILKRKLTDNEARLVVKEIKSTPYIVGYSLSEWIKAENIWVAEDEIGNLLGVCLTYDFHKDWCKIAALFVLNDFRGRGIGKALFYRSVRDALERGKNVYTISANPIVIKMIEKLKFRLFKNVFNLQNSHRNEQPYFYIHHIIWIMNLYRVKEIIRKQIVYKSSEHFVFGTLLRLDRRIPTPDKWASKLEAWQTEPNRTFSKVIWEHPIWETLFPKATIFQGFQPPKNS